MFKNKDEFIAWVEYQVSVKLVNDTTDRMNTKRKVLHTDISDQELYRVLPLLEKKGVKYQKHLRHSYFIMI